MIAGHPLEVLGGMPEAEFNLMLRTVRRRDQERAKAKRWQVNNPEAYAAARRRSYAKNRDKHIARSKAYRETHPRASRAGVDRDRYVARVYGLPPGSYDAMLASQGHACAICRVTFSGVAHVDHAHASRTVRGLLCANCNRGIGMFADQPDRLRAAAAYLEVQW